MKKLLSVLYVILAIEVFCIVACSAIAQFQQKPMLGIQVDWAHPSSKGLVGHWLFNEGSGNTVFDLSGNGNTGTNTNTSWTSGKYGSSLSYVSASSSETVLASPVIPTGDFSVVTFGRRTGSGTVNFSGFVSQYASAQSGRFFIGISGGKVAYRIGGTLKTGSDFDLSSSHHLCITRSGNDVIVYLDGKQDFTDTASDSIYQGTNTQFGAIDTLYADLDIDFVLIYNCALSASEIAELYREPFGMFVKDDIAMLATAAEPPPPPSGQIIIIIMSAIPFLIFPAFIFLKKRKS